LKFNENKTVAVMYTNKHTKISTFKKIKINDQEIKYSMEAKYLGLILDSKLTWKSHLTSKFAKAK
jgi:hypothetical protein